jgi:hypothetical protein
VVSPFPMENPLANYREMFIPIPAEYIALMDETVLKQPSIFKMIHTTNHFMDMALNFANQSINTPEFKQLMKEESFDLIILPLFLNDFQYGENKFWANENNNFIFICCISRFGRSFQMSVGCDKPHWKFSHCFISSR